MQHKPLSLALASLALLGLGAQQAAADIVLLKGGDRLSGTIVAKDDKQLTLQTAYAKEPITLLWSEVTNIETDQPARFMLNDKTLINAQATRASDSTALSSCRWVCSQRLLRYSPSRNDIPALSLRAYSASA